MLRAALGGVGALGLMALAVSAQGNVDCEAAYQRYSQMLKSEKHANIPPERLAALSRKARRAYEACRTGDVNDTRALFDRLERSKE